MAQPLLDDLAKATGELVRLAISDGSRLVWVAKAQGARTGLRVDPDAGMEAHLAASATGLAWLAALSDEKALERVAMQGMAKARGPGAPKTLVELLERVGQTRERGYAMVVDAYELGTSAIAALVRRGQSGEPLGTVSVAGPSTRMTAERMQAISPLLQECAKALSFASPNGPMRLRS
jgi:IclR family acetate operon transcriptional repressor